MSSFYRPFSLIVNTIPTIVYPMKGIEDLLDRHTSTSIQLHLEELMDRNSTLFQATTFQVVILWKEAFLMSDCWLYQQLESTEAGFTIDCKTFKVSQETKGEGITASDGLIMLGRETELEESIRKSGQDLIQNFVFGSRAHLPNDLNPTEEFFI